MKYALALIALLAAPIANAAPATIAGTASVIDGDTIEIHGQRIRLHGIDSPEGRQRCESGGKEWRCGTEAANALAGFIDRSPVSCAEKDVDQYGRIVAVCAVRGTDVNRWMVANGWAVAYRRYSRAYDDDEREARAAQRGIWAGEFQMPWDWRRAQRR